MVEEWRDVIGYEGLYEVSSLGNVRSLFRYKKQLKPSAQQNGYYAVELFKSGKSKRLLIHRLVALAFIPNPENKPQVNHKDEIRSNNRLDNLEWNTAQENMTYNNAQYRRAKNRDYSKLIERTRFRQFGADNPAAKAVQQFTKDGSFVAEYPTTSEAIKRIGATSNHISECCSGKYPSAHGYVWKYKNERIDKNGDSRAFAR